MSEITFALNGEAISISTAPDTPLVDILREHLFATETKLACGIGRCGACAVLVDGRLMNACLVRAFQLADKKIVTARGLDAVPEAAMVREALAAESAFQCGYCAPGFTLALIALLRDHPDADGRQIRTALEGNICRCTGYGSIIRGALRAAEAWRQRHGVPLPKP